MKSLTLTLWIVLVSLIGFGSLRTANGIAAAVQFDEITQPNDDSGKLQP